MGTPGTPVAMTGIAVLVLPLVIVLAVPTVEKVVPREAPVLPSIVVVPLEKISPVTLTPVPPRKRRLAFVPLLNMTYLLMMIGPESWAVSTLPAMSTERYWTRETPLPLSTNELFGPLALVQVLPPSRLY